MSDDIIEVPMNKRSQIGPQMAISFKLTDTVDNYIVVEWPDGTVKRYSFNKWVEKQIEMGLLVPHGEVQ